MLAIMVFPSFLSLTPLLPQFSTRPIGVLMMISTECPMMRWPQPMVGRVVVVAMQVLVVLDLVVRVVLVFLTVPVLFSLRRRSTLPFDPEPYWGWLLELQRYPFLSVHG